MLVGKEDPKTSILKLPQPILRQGPFLTTPPVNFCPRNTARKNPGGIRLPSLFVPMTNKNDLERYRNTQKLATKTEPHLKTTTRTGPLAAPKPEIDHHLIFSHWLS